MCSLLGPSGSGAHWHYHQAAFNSLYFGEKKWFLLPPGVRHVSNAHPSTWSQAWRARVRARVDAGASAGEGAALDAEVLTCTQREGDVLYIPSMWGE